MKKIKKNKQMSLINIKGVGRPAKIDKGIRHTAREKISKPTALHLTIKVRENKADIKTKKILKALHQAIKRARFKKLKIIHYTLEYNHLHLVVEAHNNLILQKGMQALGVSLSKAINRIKQLKGAVYKHRYHFRKLASRREFKNALLYIFKNGMKHKRSMSLLDPYNSLVCEKRIPAEMNSVIKKSLFLSNLRGELDELLDEGRVYFMNISYLWE